MAKNHKYDSQAQENAAKKLGRSVVEQMDAMTAEELKKLIVDASTRMKEVKDSLDANPKYQQIKSDLANMQAGKKAVDDNEKARIRYSLEIIQNVSKLSETEKELYEIQRKNRAEALKKKESKNG